MPGRERAGSALGGKRVEADLELRRELALCAKYRISHSHFLGGPDLWTPADRALAQAYEEWEQGNCSGCGTRREWWDPARGGHRHAMIADTDRCPGCEVKEQLRDQIPKDAKGVHVFLRPNPDVMKKILEEAEHG